MSITLPRYIEQDKPETDEISVSVLHSLLYYDLFSHPLTIEEIKTHCRVSHCPEETLKASLSKLIEEGKVFRAHQFYSIRNSFEIFLKRIKGNEAANGVMKKVISRSRLIAAFPFVRCVCISGSFSKNYYDETTDVDFFIITEPNRLWLCRTLLILFKKIFLLNSKKFFCVNYFIDSENLEIPDQNIFTATEILTLLPVYNYEGYKKFYRENNWVKSFFPHSKPRAENFSESTGSSFSKRFSEWLLRGIMGDCLDAFFFKQTLNHWKKKFGGQSVPEFEVNMRSRRNVSKHHPQGFQFQVLKRYEDRIRAFEKQHNLTLSR